MSDARLVVPLLPGRSPAARSRPALVASAVLFCAVALVTQLCGAVPIRIHGTAKLDGALSVEGPITVVRGRLTDEVGLPIPAASVTVQIVPAGDGLRPIALPSPHACGGQPRGSGGVKQPTAETYATDTDERGELCITAAGLPVNGTLRLSFAGGKLHDAASAEVPIDAAPALMGTRLRFEPGSDVLDLDAPHVVVGAALELDRRDARRPPLGGSPDRGSLIVLLQDEQGSELASAATSGDGSVSFQLEPARLGPPGLGELKLRFEGSPELARSTASHPVVRRAQVTLALAHPLEEGDPEDGIPIDIHVKSDRGAVSGGVVEVLRDGESVGASPVEAGEAHALAVFPGGRAGKVDLQMRYVPSAPWWRAGADLATSVSIKGPSIARDLVLASVVAAVTAWIVAGWRRAPKMLARMDDRGAAAPPSGRPDVQVVRASPELTGWSGRVVDAHDGAPIAGAELAIMFPAFDGDGVAAIAKADETGAFTLAADHRSDARLVVRSSGHSPFEKALPPPSVLSITLVTRRRAILDRLVQWAKHHGSPFDGPPEPTPGHVRRAATRTNAADVAGWAQEVERAAYGLAPVDADLEERLRDGEPGGRRSA